MEIITTHTGTDFDALASMVAAKKLYPEAKLSLPGSVAKEVKQFTCLYGSLLENIPSEEIDLDKVKRLILVDTRWLNRIGIFNQLISRKGVEIHIYDHHPPHPEDIEGEGGICQEVGATTSLLVSLIRKRRISISPAEATLLLLGIYEDTGSLSFTSTTPLDLEAAAYLLSQGANLELISSFLNRGLTEKQTLLLDDFLKKAQTKLINGVEIVVIVTEIDEFIGGLSLPLHKLIDLKNLEVVFVLIKSKDRVYLMARSRTPSVNVGEILSPFGGGGHNFAASALIKGTDSKEIEQRLSQVLKDRIEPRLTVGRIMSPPKETATLQMLVKEAQILLKKHKITFLPVVENSKLLGMISQKRIDRLIAHNSGNAPLKSYITPKIITCPPFISIKRAQELMMEEEAGVLFVLEEDKLVGIITGSDLLDAFHQRREDSLEENLGSLKDLLEKKVPEKIQRLLWQAGKVANKMGYRAFIVGGFVRDLLLGIENLDIDLVIEGNGIDFAIQFADEVAGKVKTHKDFGTAVLIFPDGFKLDIATSRREFYPRPASLPRVTPASLREDVFRRDFTVNTMAIDINLNSFGNLIDFFAGQKDIKEKRVGALHSKSFIEDPTRIFRAIRFEQRYGFTIEDKTLRLIQDALKRGLLQELSGERIREELIQVLQEDRPGRVIKRMQELGVLKTLHPRMRLDEEKEERLDHLVDVFARFEILFNKRVKRWLIRLLLLLEDLNGAELKEFCRRYRFNKEERESILKGKNKAKELEEKLKTSEFLKPSSIYYLLQPLSQEILLFTIARAEEKGIEKRIFDYLSKLKNIKIKVDGNDLKQMGYKPSPEFTQILEELKKAKLDGEIETREEELDYIRKRFPREETK